MGGGGAKNEERFVRAHEAKLFCFEKQEVQSYNADTAELYQKIVTKFGCQSMNNMYIACRKNFKVGQISYTAGKSLSLTIFKYGVYTAARVQTCARGGAVVYS